MPSRIPTCSSPPPSGWVWASPTAWWWGTASGTCSPANGRAPSVRRPLEVRDGDPAGIGDDVGDDGDAALGEDGVGIVRGRAVGSVEDERGADVGCVGGVDLVLQGRRDEDVDRGLEQLGAVHGACAGEAGDAPGATLVIDDGGDIEALLVVDAAGTVGNSADG